MTQQIAVIDYGMGNLRSVAKAIEAVSEGEVDVLVTSQAEVIAQADRVVFPGQGAAGACMQALRSHNLSKVIKQAFDSKPFLGICMGMQVLMTRSSENNGIDCLDLIPGKVECFTEHIDAASLGLTIPAMGWNQVEQTRDHPLWHGIDNHARFYFAHSYFVRPQDEALIVGRSNYGLQYVSAMADKNRFVVQFHPEKSAENGLKLLKNFVYWNGVV